MALFRNGSRYTNGLFTLNAAKKEFLLLRETINIDSSDKDIFLTLDGKYVQRIDLISQEMYGRPDLGWVIMDINQIRQPLFELKVGKVLRVPPLNKVLDAINQLNKNL